LLPKEDADELIKQAEADAAAARAQAAADNNLAVQAAVAQAVAAVRAEQSTPMPDDDAVRITYIPEAVKAQIKDEIRADVMSVARITNGLFPAKCLNGLSASACSEMFASGARAPSIPAETITPAPSRTSTR
jgi:hypothetical protein